MALIKKTKLQVYTSALSLFVKVPVQEELITAYFNDEDGEATFSLQSWILNNMRDEIADWCTGIGVIDSLDLLYDEALFNGNV